MENPALPSRPRWQHRSAEDSINLHNDQRSARAAPDTKAAAEEAARETEEGRRSSRLKATMPRRKKSRALAICQNTSSNASLLILDRPELLAVYNTPTPVDEHGSVYIYGEHPVILASVRNWQSKYAPILAEQIRKVVEEAYGWVAVCKIAHSEHLKTLFNSEIVDEEMRNPVSLTFALLGLMSEDALIAERLNAVLKARRMKQEKVA